MLRVWVYEVQGCARGLGLRAYDGFPTTPPKYYPPGFPRRYVGRGGRGTHVIWVGVSWLGV